MPPPKPIRPNGELTPQVQPPKTPEGSAPRPTSFDEGQAEERAGQAAASEDRTGADADAGADAGAGADAANASVLSSSAPARVSTAPFEELEPPTTPTGADEAIVAGEASPNVSWRGCPLEVVGMWSRSPCPRGEKCGWAILDESLLSVQHERRCG